MRAILHSLLIIAVMFVYVAGPYLTVEMEHSHEICQSHGHQHEGDLQDDSHHSHDQDSLPFSEVPESEEPDGNSHSHTHVDSLGADAPFTHVPHNAFMVNRIGTYPPVSISGFVPDGPYFPLIKPPQVG